MNGPSLLSPGDQEEFERPGRFIARTAIEPFAEGVPCTPARPCDLFASLRDRHRLVRASLGRWPLAAAIGVLLTAGVFEIPQLALRSRPSAASSTSDSRLLIATTGLVGTLALVTRYLP
jgi:hypothetical protein